MAHLACLGSPARLASLACPAHLACPGHWACHIQFRLACRLILIAGLFCPFGSAGRFSHLLPAFSRNLLTSQTVVYHPAHSAQPNLPVQPLRPSWPMWPNWQISPARPSFGPHHRSAICSGIGIEWDLQREWVLQWEWDLNRERDLQGEWDWGRLGYRVDFL